MATAILTSAGSAEDRLADAARQLLAAWRAHRRIAADRAALARAGRLGPRLMADMGLDADTTRALVGDWDQLRPNGWLVKPVR